MSRPAKIPLLCDRLDVESADFFEILNVTLMELRESFDRLQALVSDRLLLLRGR